LRGIKKKKIKLIKKYNLKILPLLLLRIPLLPLPLEVQLEVALPL
jgi:hypothetical protein